MSTINTNRGKKVSIKLWKQNDVPLSLVYKNQGTQLPINLTNYRFEFKLMDGESEIKSYIIEPSVLSTPYLSKTGTDVNELNTLFMWEDIQQQVQHLKQCEMMQIVTNDEGVQLIHITYTIYVAGS